MDEYMALIDAIRAQAAKEEPVREVLTLTSGSRRFDVVIEGNK